MRYNTDISYKKVFWGMRFILAGTLVVLMSLSVAFFDANAISFYDGQSSQDISQDLEVTKSSAKIKTTSYKCDNSYSAKCNSSSCLLYYNTQQYMFFHWKQKQFVLNSHTAVNGYAPDIMLPPPKFS